MAISVLRVGSIVDGQVLLSDRFESSRGKVRPGDLIGLLTSFDPHPSGDGPVLSVIVNITDGPNRQAIPLALERVLSAEEYNRSQSEPMSLARIEAARSRDPDCAVPELFWLFKDHIYATSRMPGQTERGEVVLRIKALQFKSTESIKRLREKVANFEATESLPTARAARAPLSDDVKLLVWARDGGKCIKCGRAGELHFDHVVPVSKGGGDHAENIQLLCRSCNLSKGGRLV